MTYKDFASLSSDYSVVWIGRTLRGRVELRGRFRVQSDRQIATQWFQWFTAAGVAFPSRTRRFAALRLRNRIEVSCSDVCDVRHVAYPRSKWNCSSAGVLSPSVEERAFRRASQQRH